MSQLAHCLLLASLAPARAWLPVSSPPHECTHRPPSSRRTAVHQMCTSEDSPPERRPPVELLALSVSSLTDEQIESIHDVADTLFNVLDRNGDEAISKEELAAHLLLARYSEEAIQAIFDLLDVNQDGQVSRNELRQA
eukprot:3807811-Prymnesium_polylepis.1